MNEKVTSKKCEVYYVIFPFHYYYVYNMTFLYLFIICYTNNTVKSSNKEKKYEKIIQIFYLLNNY